MAIGATAQSGFTTQGVRVTIADLLVTDVDNTADEILYTITETVNGSVWLQVTTEGGFDGDDQTTADNGAAWWVRLGSDRATAENIASAFTAADVAAGRVRFFHDGSETTTGGFTVTASDTLENEDGERVILHTTDPIDVTVTVTPVNDAPTQDPANTPGTAVDWPGQATAPVGDNSMDETDIREGGIATVTVRHIGVYDPDDAPSAVTYELVSLISDATQAVLQWSATPSDPTSWETVVIGRAANTGEVRLDTLHLAGHY